MKLPTPGKDLLENNLFLSNNGTDDKAIEYGTFREPTDEVWNCSSISIDLYFPTTDNKPSRAEKKQMVEAWVNVLPKLSHVTELYIRHRVDDVFIDAISQMEQLEDLTIWGSSVEDISALGKLTNLKRLVLHSFSKLTSIAPLLLLKNITRLTIENSFNITDYHRVGEMSQLVALSIQGDEFAPKRVMLDRLKDFSQLSNLKHLDMTTASIKEKDFEELLELKNLVRLDAHWRMKKAIREQIKSEHPSLKSGFFMKYDFVKNAFYPGVEWWVKE